MDKDFKRIRKRYFRCLIGLLILIILIIIKPGVAIDNYIIKFYYYISIIGVGFVGVIYPIFINVIEEDEHGQFWKKIIYEVSDILSLFIILCCLCQAFFAFGFFRAQVEGESMLNTLEPNDVLIVRSTSKVENFDIVIVQLKKDKNHRVNEEREKELLVKRLIGHGGDEIYYYNGNWYLNGEKLGSYSPMFDLDQGIEYKDGSYYIKDGYYFVMGDNRNHSSDSRVFGLFMKDQIVGKVKYRVKSLFKWEKVDWMYKNE